MALLRVSVEVLVVEEEGAARERLMAFEHWYDAFKGTREFAFQSFGVGEHRDVGDELVDCRAVVARPPLFGLEALHCLYSGDLRDARVHLDAGGKKAWNQLGERGEGERGASLKIKTKRVGAGKCRERALRASTGQG